MAKRSRSLPSPILCLPFVKKVGRNLDHWAVTPTGDWVIDHDAGQDYALLYLEFRKHSYHWSRLSEIVAAMVKRGVQVSDPIATGFLQILDRMAVIPDLDRFRHCLLLDREETKKWFAARAYEESIRRSERARIAAQRRRAKKGGGK